jgi:hypothetical protein
MNPRAAPYPQVVRCTADVLLRAFQRIRYDGFASVRCSFRALAALTVSN